MSLRNIKIEIDQFAAQLDDIYIEDTFAEGTYYPQSNTISVSKWALTDEFNSANLLDCIKKEYRTKIHSYLSKIVDELFQKMKMKPLEQVHVQLQISEAVYISGLEFSFAHNGEIALHPEVDGYLRYSKFQLTDWINQPLGRPLTEAETKIIDLKLMPAEEIEEEITEYMVEHFWDTAYDASRRAYNDFFEVPKTM